jgi:hypothetical protein
VSQPSFSTGHSVAMAEGGGRVGGCCSAVPRDRAAALAMERSARRRPPDLAPRAPENHRAGTTRRRREKAIEQPIREVKAYISAGETRNPDRIRDRVHRRHAAERGSGAALWTRVGVRPGQRERAGRARSALLPRVGRSLPPTAPRTPGTGAAFRTPMACSGASRGGGASSAWRAHKPSVKAGPGRSTGRCGVRTAGRFRLAWRPIHRRGRPG